MVRARSSDTQKREQGMLTMISDISVMSMNLLLVIVSRKAVINSLFLSSVNSRTHPVYFTASRFRH